MHDYERKWWFGICRNERQAERMADAAAILAVCIVFCVATAAAAWAWNL